MKADPSFSDEKCYCRIRFSHRISLHSRRKDLVIPPKLAVEAAPPGQEGTGVQREAGAQGAAGGSHREGLMTRKASLLSVRRPQDTHSEQRTSEGFRNEGCLGV